MSGSRTPLGRRLLRLLGTGLGSGYSPLVPGTAGTLAALPFAYLLGQVLSPLVFAIFAAAFVVPAIAAAESVARTTRETDPGIVVVDEWAGLFITLAGHPVGLMELGAAFFIFRVLDIVKPPPARQLERLHGGVGIVLDDVAAGLYGNLALWLLRLWL